MLFEARKKSENKFDFGGNLPYVVSMNQIQDLIRQINNAERMGLSIAEITEAKKVLQIEFAKLAFIVDKAVKL